MAIKTLRNGNYQLETPCIFCTASHRFTVDKNLFYDSDFLALPCRVTGSTVAVVGEENHVKAELARNELELLDLMEKCGVENFDAFRKKNNETEDETDPQILSDVLFVLKDLDEENKIFCRCNPEKNEKTTADGETDSAGPQHRYTAEETEDGILVSCPTCGAKRLIPIDNGIATQAFLTADKLILE